MCKFKRAITCYLLVLFLGFILAGFTKCIGLVDNLSEHRKVYCDQTNNSLAKDLAIKTIQRRLPGYPEEGLCTEAGRKDIEQADTTNTEGL